MSSNSIYNLPYTYLIGWSSLDLYYYGRRTAMDCHPSDLFESYFTSSTEVEHYVSEYGIPDIIQVRKTFDNNDDCCEWECKVLRRLDAKNNPRLLNKTNGDSEWIYSSIDAIWMNRNGNNRRVRREHIGHYKDVGWVEGRAVDWIWIKKGNESKRVSDDVIDSYLEDGWERGRVINISGERNFMYGRTITEEHRKAISKANKGVKKSEEFCKKTSERMKGENNPLLGRIGKDSAAFKGYWYTPHGTFESMYECMNNVPADLSTNKVTLSKWCRNNNLIISLISYRKSKYLQYYFTEDEAVGKTFEQLGFKRE